MPARGRPRSFDRAEALRQAMELFWVKGYALTSIADLTAAMGINSPSLYAAFGSKEALFREAVELYGRTEGTEIWDALPEAPTAQEALRGFLEATALSFSRPDRPAGCLIVLGALHGEPSSGPCRELRELRLDNVQTLQRRLERAVAEGELPPQVDCRAVATFYATVQQGMSIQARDGASREDLLGVARSAMRSWEALTSAGAARGSPA